jgi:hypothetical protein
MKILRTMLMLLTTGSVANAATYYVCSTLNPPPTGFTACSPNGSDSANGSSSSPWQTIAHAASKAAAGDTVIVENGTYQEVVRFENSGTSGSSITFQAQNKWGAVIAPTSAQLAGGTVLMTTGSYITVKNFEVIGPSDGSASGGLAAKYYSTHQTNISFIGNRVHRIGTGNCLQGAAIFISAHNALADSNLVYDTSPPRSTSTCYYMHGFYISGVINTTVTNNIVAGIYKGNCLQFDSYSTSEPLTGFVVSNNTFANCGQSSPASGGGVFYACSPAGCGNNKINNNIFSSIQSQTFDIEYGNFGTTDQISNNLIYNSAGSILTAPETLVNTVTGDPLFINYTGDQTGDYHLQATSPAIDHGTSLGAPSSDFDGNPRPQGAGYDIGGYEYVGSYVGSKPNPPTNLTVVVN